MGAPVGIFSTEFDTRQPLKLEESFSTRSFHEVQNLIAEHDNVPGVPKERDALKQSLLKFDTERAKLIDSLQPSCDAAHEKLMAAVRKHKRMKLLLIGSLVACVIFMILYNPFLAMGARDSFALSLILLIILIIIIIAIPLGGVLTLYTTFKLNKAADEDRKTRQEALSHINDVMNSFKAKNAKACLRIDHMYLDSLSPEERQLILMRREQARQHQALMNQQRAHQARLELQQQQVARATQELLEIEYERERRRKGY